MFMKREATLLVVHDVLGATSGLVEERERESESEGERREREREREREMA